MKMKRKFLRVLAGFLGVFMILSGFLLLSPVFDNDLLDRVNGAASFVFAFFILCYAIEKEK